MDYSKVPLCKRTRLQHDLFYKKYYEEKKRAEMGNGGGGDSVGSGSGERGGRELEVSGARVEGHRSAAGGGKGVVVGGAVSTGQNEGFDSVKIGSKLKKGSKSRVEIDVGSEKTGKKSKKGLKSRVEIDDGSKKIGKKSKKGLKNKVSGSVRLKGKRVDDDYDNDDAGSDDEVEFIGEYVIPNGSTSKTGSGLRVGCEEGKNFDYLDPDMIISSRNSKESPDISDGDSVDSEDSAELESSSEEDNDDKDYVDVSSSSDISDDSKDDYEEEAEEDDAHNGEEMVKNDKINILKRKRGDGMGKEKMGGLKRKSAIDSAYIAGLEREDGNGNSSMKEGSDDGKENDKNSKGGLNRRKLCGLDILVDSENEKVEEHKSPSKRLRPRPLSKSRKDKLNLGTVNRPFTVDEDTQLDSSSGHDDDDDCDATDTKDVRKIGGEGKKPLVNLGVRKHAHIDFDPLKILADSIFEMEDRLLEKIVSPEEKTPHKETLVYKFSLALQDPKPPEKPEQEREIDALFAELEMGLISYEIGSSDYSMVDNDATISTGPETDPATLCRQGKHQRVLDEQIGLICKFCSFVEVEIKDLLPSFAIQRENPWERWEKNGFRKADSSIFSEFQFQDFGCEYQYRSKGCFHDKGTVWDIIPGTKENMYPHQRDGFEFVWKNIAGGIYIEKLEKPLSNGGGSGCIISHAPGTGKTRLTLVFLQTFMRLYPESRPVIIAPCSMLLTWEEEFRKWNVDVPFHNLNMPEFSGHENTTAVNFLKKVGKHGRSKNSIRMLKLYSWTKGRSILGISYPLFEKLAGGGEKKRKVHHPQEEIFRKCLLELPSLLVLDEGHTPRNDQSLIWKALSKVETQRRIILSGTPFQNNFDELYNTLCLVNPKFTDRILYYGVKKSGGKSNAAKGKWDSLTNSIGQNADGKLRELRDIIDPFVHVHKGSILQEKLPGLRDALVVLRPTDLQKSVLKSIQGRKSWLELAHLVSLISVHPSLVSDCLSQKEFSAYKGRLEKVKLDPYAGVKTKFLIELIRLSETLNEKVLVFSQFIDPLTFIMELLKTHFDWILGREVLYMDGKLDKKQRQSSITSLNDPTSEVRVLLASTKACSEGINLVGASRVVLLDVVWNPSVERQAISRAYRLGQKKIVYIYHLITSGTMEGEKYVRQAEKDRLSEMVFSSTNRNSCKREMSSTVAEDKILEEMVQHKKLSNIFEKILYQPKESDLVETFGLVDP